MAIIILYMTAHVYSSPRLLRHVYTPMTPLTLAWGWYSSGTLSSLFLYDALHEWADGDPYRVHWINPTQFHPKHEHD